MDGADVTSAAIATTTQANTPRRWRPAPLVRLSIVFHGLIFLAFLLFPAHWCGFLLALLGNHLLLGGLGLWPTSRLVGPNILRLPATAAARGEITLTFDDGPDAQVTPPLLDLLDRYGAKASFFLAARQAAMHPALVQDIVRRGHSVENHSYSHSNAFAWYGLGRLHREIGSSQALIAKLSGRLPTFFRAPMGLRSPLLDPVLARLGLRHVAWTRRGFDTVKRDPDVVLRRLVNGLAVGDVLLLHDGNAARTRDGEAVVLAVLPRLLETIAAQDLKSVSLPMAFEDK